MATHNHHHHHHHHLHHHRPVPISLPSSRFLNNKNNHHYPSSPFPFSPSYSLSTPSKTRRHLSSSSSSSSYSSLFLLLLSLRSLYSLLPFLRSSPPSFSLFPFSFLVSLLSLLLLLPFSSPSSINLSKSHLYPLALSSLLQTLSLLLRFHSLRYCSAAAAILSDLAGSLLASSLLNPNPKKFKKKMIPAILSLFLSLFLMSRSWDRIGCSPLSATSADDTRLDSATCDRLLPMLLPFLSGFISFHQTRYSSASPPLRQLGRRRLRLLSLSFTTLFLLFPALLTFLTSQSPLLSSSVSASSLGWQLTNIVIFGVVLGENCSDGSEDNKPRDFRKEFMVTFLCTLLLELVYVPKLSLPGFLFCGFLLWFSVRELGSSSYSTLNYVDASESLYSMVMNPVRHILSERKSRKIALFLLINAGYMVVEFVVGFMSNSLGLISDACHMLFDCAALAIGLYASYISRLPANHQYNYGRGRFEVLSGYVNAVLLVLVGALIVLESIERILDPQEISTNSLLTVSVGGFLVNVVGLVFFHEEHHHAHGGGGTCSHSHSHSHSHHDHDHHEHESIGCNKEHSVEHQKCVEVSHESSNLLTHDGHHHHREDRHDHHCHAHQHDHHGHGQEHDNQHHDGHDHHCHGQEHGQHHHEHHDIHLDSSESKHEHKNLDISLRGSHNHSHESHTHTGCHTAKECCSHSGESPKAIDTLLAPKNSRKHRHMDHNMEGIFLHVLADTLGSVGVVVSTLLIKYKGWLVADPASSIFISVMIISSVIPLLKNSAEILLQRVPRAHEQDLREALDDLRKIRGVCGVRKLHVWNLTNTDIVGTLHLHVSPETDKATIRSRASELFRDAGIKDLTIQVESMTG